MNTLVNNLKEQIKQLKTEILNITNQIETIRNEGDDSDVGISIELQDKLDLLIEKLEKIQKNLSIYQNSSKSDFVDLGKNIEFAVNGLTRSITLVLPEDADPTLGFISIESPVGNSLLNKKNGDSAIVETDNGIVEYKIYNIS